MARKRAAKKQKAPVVKPSRTLPLMEAEGRFFQELVDSSNQYTNLLKQESQYKFVLAKLNTDRKRIQDGDIEFPLLMTLIPKLISYWEHDKKKVLKIFDDQIKSYTANLWTLKGQIDSKYENYLESAARNKEFLNTRFQSAKPKNIVAVRDVGEKDEQVLFEAEFQDLIKDADKQEELKKAQKEAVKRNVARKKKTI